jgi:hypothetical protein
VRDCVINFKHYERAKRQGQKDKTGRSDSFKGGADDWGNLKKVLAENESLLKLS